VAFDFVFAALHQTKRNCLVRNLHLDQHGRDCMPQGGFACRQKIPRMNSPIVRRFGRLTVISYARNQRWCCDCACGRRTVILGQSLRRGLTKSCGCVLLARSPADPGAGRAMRRGGVGQLNGWLLFAVALGALAGTKRNPTAFPLFKLVFGSARTAVEIDLGRKIHRGIVAPSVDRPRMDSVARGLLLAREPTLGIGIGHWMSSLIADNDELSDQKT
jgi:hypothetical protein